MMKGLAVLTVPYVWSKKSSIENPGFVNGSAKIFARVDTAE